MANISRKRKNTKLKSKKKTGGDNKCNTHCELKFPDEKFTIYKKSNGLGKASTYWVKKDNDDFEWFKINGKKEFISAMFDCETRSDKWLLRIKNATDNELGDNFKGFNTLAKEITIDLWKKCRESKK
jgi:hypothetical protein